MPRKLSCKIHSYTHDFYQEAFSVFDHDDLNFGISNLKKESFILEITDILEPSLSDLAFANKAHAVFNLFIVALNVATLGLLISEDDKQLSPNYRFYRDNNLVWSGVVVHDIHGADLKGRNMTSSETYEALCLYGALAREENNELVSEYLKGLIHLSLSYPGANFEKDAFSNFYRVFEHIVTRKILNQKKLKNEFRQLSESLRSLGFSQVIIGQFKEMYSLLGENKRCTHKSHL